MIVSSSGLKVMMATRPIDFRKGMDGLIGLVKEQVGADPFSGAVFVFRAKRTDRLKLVYWDGTGTCLLTKRMEDRGFHWPKIIDGVIHLTPAQFSALLEGLDWRRVRQSRDVMVPVLSS